jgi:hypothetical protein
LHGLQVFRVRGVGIGAAHEVHVVLNVREHADCVIDCDFPLGLAAVLRRSRLRLPDGGPRGRGEARQSRLWAQISRGLSGILLSGRGHDCDLFGNCIVESRVWRCAAEHMTVHEESGRAGQPQAVPFV